MKIAVLMGGVSEETRGFSRLRSAGGFCPPRCRHEVMGVDTSHGALSAAEEVALLESGIKDPHPPAHTRDLLRTGDIAALTRDPRIAGTDVVFLTLHGGGGEDGTIQTLLGLAGIPFVGSESIGCALAMDKDLSKRILRDAGIPTPRWITTCGREEGMARLGGVFEELGAPLIVKPPSGGSTLGLTLAHDEQELRRALELALEYEDRVLFEEYVRGRELTVGILGGEALPVGEIIPEHEIFDYECKYRDGMAQEIFPAVLDQKSARNVQAKALAAHRVLRLRDFSRVDFILDSAGTPWCLEANALPGLTGNSLLPKAAREAGISFPELCHRLAEMALIRSRS